MEHSAARPAAFEQRARTALLALGLAALLGGVAATPAFAEEGWRGRDGREHEWREHERREHAWREHEWREHEWREHEWREHYHYGYAPGYAYPPAFAYQPPPPAYVAPPTLSFVFPLR
jgi:hypothetical protein